jgi:hypothetical protein
VSLDLRKLHPLIIHGSTKQIQLSILTTIWCILKTDNITQKSVLACVIMELTVCKRKGAPPRYQLEVPSFWHLNLGYRSGWKLDTYGLTLFEYLFSSSLECQYHVPPTPMTYLFFKIGLYLTHKGHRGHMWPLRWISFISVHVVITSIFKVICHPSFFQFVIQVFCLLQNWTLFSVCTLVTLGFHIYGCCKMHVKHPYITSYPLLSLSTISVLISEPHKKKEICRDVHSSELP